MPKLQLIMRPLQRRPASGYAEKTYNQRRLVYTEVRSAFPTIGMPVRGVVMRNRLLLLLLSTVFLFPSSAQTFKPEPLDFANTYGTWITGKALSLKFSREGGTGCQALVADLSKMPGGFTWTAGGVDNGTLAGTFSSTGEYKFSLSVQCSGVGSAALTYAFKVNQPMSLAPGPYLAGAHVGGAWAAFLKRNGVKPYNLTLVSGALPPGLAWDADSGVLVGSPTAAGTYTFRAKIADRMTTSGEEAYTLVVGPPGVFYASTDRLEFRAMVGGAADTVPLGVATGDLSVVNYTAKANAAWLTATPVTGKTPDQLNVQMNPAGLAKGTHQAQITLTPDGGKNPITVAVTAQVGDPYPKLGAAPDRLQVDVLPDESAPREFQFHFHAWNDGTGTLTANATAWSGPGNATWLSVQPAQISVAAGQMQSLSVGVNAKGLAPGSYNGSIAISAATGAKTIPVLLVVPPTQHVPILKLSDSSWGTAADWVNLEDRFNYVNSHIMVSNDDSATSFDFTTRIDGFATGAAIEPTQGRIGPWPGQMELNFRFNNFRLGVATREGLLTVTAPGAKNSPAYARLKVDIQPTGAITGSANTFSMEAKTPILVGAAGSTTPLQAQIVITNSSNVPVAYRIVSDQPGAVTFDLPVGTVGRDEPVTVTASVDPAKLSARWSKLLLAADPSVAAATFKTAPLTVVTPAARSTAPLLRPAALASTPCTASRLVLAAAAPLGGFRQPADEPLKLRAFVYDDCGVPVADAMVSASFSNGDATAMLRVSDTAKGIYEAAWIPGAAAPNVTVDMRATRSSLAAATDRVFGTVTEDSCAPVIYNGGIVNASKSVAGDPVSPGGVVSIYGRNLAGGTEPAAAVPLPRTLAGAKVLIGGIEAPLFYVSPGQINAQVPFELSADAPCNVVVLSGNRVSTPKALQLVKLDPGVVAYADGRVIAQHADYSLITASSPARPNEAIILYLVGMGPASIAVATGAATPYPPLADVSVQPEMTIGGIKARVNWAGLVPGGVGLYQVVCTVPDSAPAGELALVLTQGGAAANQVKLPVAR